MNKDHAIELFGGVTRLAEAIGVSSQAISQWPASLTPKMADRVTAAWARKHLAKRLPQAVQPAKVA